MRDIARDEATGPAVGGPPTNSAVSTTAGHPSAIETHLRDAPPEADRPTRAQGEAILVSAAIAREAESRLLRTRPARCAGRLPRGGRRLIAPAAALCAVALGLMADASLVWRAVQGITALAFLSLMLVRLVACLTPRRARLAPDLADDALPVYTVIAPLYREANVLPALVEALDRLDYPRDKLDIKIVLEESDHETRAVAEALCLEAPYEVLIAPHGAPRTKPRALNMALALGRGALVTIFDAEDRPHPAQLRAAASAFASGPARLACVQAPLGWWNAKETWLTRQFALEYAAQFHVILPALARWGWPLPLGGTSNHFRAEALEACGGWDPYNVTEDADIGYRLAEDGWTSDVIAHGTLEEATTRLAPWTLQRSRWIKGFLQTLLVRLREPAALWRGAGWRGAASLTFFIALTIASALVHLVFIAGVAASLGVALVAPNAHPPLSLWFLTLLAGGYLSAAACALLGAWRSENPALALSVASMPVYWPLQTWAAFRALRELAMRPFHWEKTRHGVTRLVAPGSGRTAR